MRLLFAVHIDGLMRLPRSIKTQQINYGRRHKTPYLFWNKDRVIIHVKQG